MLWGQGGGQRAPRPHVAEHAPFKSVALFGCRSHADNQGLTISSEGMSADVVIVVVVFVVMVVVVLAVADDVRPAIRMRSSGRPGGARGILRVRRRQRQLLGPGASLRAAGVPPLAATDAPGGRLPGPPARLPGSGPPTALAHAACTSHHCTVNTIPRWWAAILRRLVGNNPPRPGASCAGRLSLDTGAAASE